MPKQPGTLLERARRAAASVVDPELPMLTLLDLGVLRAVEVDQQRVVVTITPTYSGCPAMATMRADLLVALRRADLCDVEVRTRLHPPWSTGWISSEGLAKLAAAGISPPEPVTDSAGPVPLTLLPPARQPGQPVASPIGLSCPECGGSDTRETSRFGSTACLSLHVCRSCGEPFSHVKAR